ncbi:MAG: isoaspartyl peptidase/L-asparaginase family protein [Bacteroidia bacterium]
MKFLITILIFTAGLFSCKSNQQSESNTEIEAPVTDSTTINSVVKKHQLPAIVLHGGAGWITKESMQNGLEQQYKNALDSAITIGYILLDSGASALVAVEKTINYLENHPLFNAGKGAVLNAEGNAELDASIMDGSNLNAGGVAGVKTVKNPISLARMVKDSTKHVLLCRDGAEDFAVKMKLEPMEPEYFITPKTREAREKRIKNLHKMGTVGCVAIDVNGNIAAGTSTGGMDKKQFGRIGDSPLIGAGTYANNKTCGVSCTGHGEYFIKNAVAYDLSAQIEYLGKTAPEAANQIIHRKLAQQDAKGGLIALDKNGNVAISFNTPGMFWAYKVKGNTTLLGMYKSDVLPKN